MQFQTTQLPARANYTAPDGSEIRLLPDVKNGGLPHCTLYPSHTSAAVKHHSIEEIWYFIQGQGEVWRRPESLEAIEVVRPGVCITSPTQTHFQFRNTGTVPLKFIIATMPPRPGANEAERVRDHWTTSALEELAAEYRTWRIAIGPSGLCVLRTAGPVGQSSLARLSSQVPLALSIGGGEIAYRLSSAVLAAKGTYRSPRVFHESKNSLEWILHADEFSRQSKALLHGFSLCFGKISSPLVILTAFTQVWMMWFSCSRLCKRPLLAV